MKLVIVFGANLFWGIFRHQTLKIWCPHLVCNKTSAHFLSRWKMKIFFQRTRWIFAASYTAVLIASRISASLLNATNYQNNKKLFNKCYNKRVLITKSTDSAHTNLAPQMMEMNSTRKAENFV